MFPEISSSSPQHSRDYHFEVNVDPKLDKQWGKGIQKKISLAELKNFDSQSYSPKRGSGSNKKGKSIMNVYKLSDSYLSGAQTFHNTTGSQQLALSRMNYGGNSQDSFRQNSTSQIRTHKASKLINRINSNMDKYAQPQSTSKRGSAYAIESLVVNQEPEIPLRVALNKVDLSVKVIDLKKKNLERFEIIQTNQELIAEK